MIRRIFESPSHILQFSFRMPKIESLIRILKIRSLWRGARIGIAVVFSLGTALKFFKEKDDMAKELHDQIKTEILNPWIFEKVFAQSEVHKKFMNLLNVSDDIGEEEWFISLWFISLNKGNQSTDRKKIISDLLLSDLKELKKQEKYKYAQIIDALEKNYDDESASALIKAYDQMQLRSKSIGGDQSMQTVTIGSDKKQLSIKNSVLNDLFVNMKKRMIDGTPKFFQFRQAIVSNLEHNQFLKILQEINKQCLDDIELEFQKFRKDYLTRKQNRENDNRRNDLLIKNFLNHLIEKYKDDPNVMKIFRKIGLIDIVIDFQSNGNQRLIISHDIDGKSFNQKIEELHDKYNKTYNRIIHNNV